MYNVTPMLMNLVSMLMTMLLCANLLGCTSNGTVDANADAGADSGRISEVELKQLEDAKIARFESVRAMNRRNLADKAKDQPEQVARVTLSLFDYTPIEYLEEFEKTYPTLKIVKWQLVGPGAKTWFSANPEKPLREELNRMIEEERKLYEQILEERKRENPREFPQESIDRSIRKAQKNLDELSLANTKTSAFVVEGKLKDIEAMAQKEYDGKYLRVVNVNFKMQDREMKDVYIGTPYAPEYAPSRNINMP